MKAIVVTAFGGPERLEVVELPVPGVSPGEVLVAVEAAGVGLADVLLRQGALPHLQPGFTPGLEMAGVVIAVGDGVDEAWLGSRVFGMVRTGHGPGFYAEFVALGVDQVVPLPPPVSSAQAVALGVNALVAEFVLRRAQVKPGENVLVRGASGGIGLMGVQLAARYGAIVTAATSQAALATSLVDLGAAHVVDRAGVPFDGVAPDVYDVIVDPVAGPDMLAFTDKLANNGRLVLAGVAGGFPPAELGAALLNQRSLTFSMLSLDTVDMTERQRALREIFAMAVRGELTSVIHERMELERAAEAHAILEAGGIFGKLVLQVDR